MANQENYKSNLQTLSEQYNKYTVSRIVATTKDNLLEMEVPADFPQRITKANIEINLYSLSDNSLIVHSVPSNSGIIEFSLIGVFLVHIGSEV